MKDLQSLAIDAILAARTTFSNLNQDKKEEWMTDKVIQVVSKLSNHPYSDLYDSIRDSRPLESLATSLSFHVLHGDVNNELYVPVRDTLIKVLFPMINDVLENARDALYRESLRKEAAERKSLVPDVPPTPVVFDKDEFLLSEDELLEESAEFWPEDDVLQDRVRRRRNARRRRSRNED